jgi:hypothetical protein
MIDIADADRDDALLGVIGWNDYIHPGRSERKLRK